MKYKENKRYNNIDKLLNSYNPPSIILGLEFLIRMDANEQTDFATYVTNKFLLRKYHLSVTNKSEGFSFMTIYCNKFKFKALDLFQHTIYYNPLEETYTKSFENAKDKLKKIFGL